MSEATTPFSAPASCPFRDGDPLLRAYHDEEWGRPELDSRALWEALVLISFAAGLSWLTVLRKREALRSAFADFEPALVARFTQRDVVRLLDDEQIIRSPPKIQAAIDNARAYEAMREAGDDFASFVWSAASASTSRVELCNDLAEALRERGFRFIGPVLVHSWLESIGVWNDHAPHCELHAELLPLSPLSTKAWQNAAQ
jgi:DNA-3-methyladenine glycosylase I